MNILKIENKFSVIHSGLKLIVGHEEKQALLEVEFLLAEVRHYAQSMASLGKDAAPEVEHRLLSKLSKFHEAEFNRAGYASAADYQAALASLEVGAA